MTRHTKLRLAAALAVTVVGSAALFTFHLAPFTFHRDAEKATYYCPMHPTYTSDRPGSCPICNMTLVKKDGTQDTGRKAQGTAKTQKDVCYMHTCPMMKPGQQCPMLVMAKAGEKVVCPICGAHVAEAAGTSSVAPAAGEKHILYWTDPMLPGYKSDKPGTSPMGMDLIPVYEENGVLGAAPSASPEGYASILVTPQKQQFIGVTTAPVVRRALTKTIRTVGRIAYDPELYQAEAEYVHALSGLLAAQASGQPEVIEQATAVVEAGRMRLRLMGLNDELMNDMMGWPGPDARLLLNDSSGQVWVYASVYEFELPVVHVGSQMRVDAPALGGATWTGTIRAVDAVLDPATRSARVRAVLDDPQRLLKPEMFVNASLVVELGEVLAIPEDAVFNTGTKQITFVDKGQGLFEPRDVTIGVKAEGYYEVKAGISEGEMVVTSGNFLIDSESRLKAALQGMSGGEHQHGQ